MSTTITINPITRVEGHGKISLHLDDQGNVTQAQMHVTQVRGFEKFCVGRPFTEMPAITARICGICPVSHIIASSKACDAILAVQIPPAAEKIRRVMHLAQIVQSHALHFFHLASPDLLLGFDSDPASRNIFGVMQAHPAIARDGIALRKFGQQVIEIIGGKRIHPMFEGAGGSQHPLSVENRDLMLNMLPNALDIAERTVTWFRKSLENYREEIRTFGNFRSYFMAVVDKKGNLDHYDGKLRMINDDGDVVEDGVPAHWYNRIIGEAVEPWSYLKSPYYKAIGYPMGMYRVGPLARLNVVNRCGTPRADQELLQFREFSRGPVLSSFHYHYARLIEILHALERMELLLNDPEILDPHVRAYAGPNNFEGIGIAEAPRGTLIHHYKIQRNGLIEWVNLIIASGHNNLAMNTSILQVAKQYVQGLHLTEGMLNRVESVIRAYDPCLSCSTHAVGQMPLHIDLYDAEHTLVDTLVRNDE